MAAVSTAVIAGLAAANMAYSSKRAGDARSRQKKLQKAIDAKLTPDELAGQQEAARNRARLARTAAMGRYGHEDTIRGGSSLGMASRAKTLLGE